MKIPSEVTLGEYRRSGFVVLDGFAPPALGESFTRGVCELLKMQCMKLANLRREWLELESESGGSAQRILDGAIGLMWTRDRAAMLEAFSMIGNTSFGRQWLVQSELTTTVGTILGAPEEILQITGPHLRVNVPGTLNRLYTWHSESHWYPKRRNFCNVWIPHVRPKGQRNGTMYMRRGSHVRHWDFSEFHGYDQNSLGKRDFFLQYDVPDQETTAFEEVRIDAGVGDAVIFHQNTLHRSSLNETELPSYTIEFRCYDYRNDLTIHSGTGERPYSGTSADNGRPGMLTVEPPR